MKGGGKRRGCAPRRIPKLAVILKPRTLFRFHEALKKCKYRDGAFDLGYGRNGGYSLIGPL
jgi:hypothetical protein